MSVRILSVICNILNLCTAQMSSVLFVKYFLNQQTQTWHGMSYNSIKESRASDVTYSCRILLWVPFTYQTLLYKSIYDARKIHYLHQVEKFKNMK